MHELNQFFNTYDYYDPLILKLIGSAFINYHPNEGLIHDEICLEHLGAYIISKLKSEEYTFPDKVIYRIAHVKRWDTTQIVGKAIVSDDDRIADDYLDMIEMKFAWIIADKSAEEVMHSFLHHVLQNAPQIIVNMELISESLKEKPLQDQIKILIDHFQKLDQTLKDNALLKLSNESHNPLLLCTLHLLKAARQLDCLSYNGILNATKLQKENTHPDQIKAFNLELTETMIEMFITSLSDQDLTIFSQGHAQSLNVSAIKAIQFLVTYCSDSPKLSANELNEYIGEINEKINLFKRDISNLTNIYTILHNLLTTLENDPLKEVSASIVSILKSPLEKVAAIKSDFVNYLNQFENIKSTIETFVTLRSDQDLTVPSQNHLQSLYRFGQKADQCFETFCLDSSKLSINELNQVINEIDDKINHIKSDISKINKIYRAFHQLLPLLENAPTTKDVAKPAFLQLEVIRAHFNHYVKRLAIIKSEVECLTKALKLNDTTVYPQWQEIFINFNKRFAEPPQQMRSLIVQLTEDFEVIQSSVNIISNFIKDKDNDVSVWTLTKGNYIDHQKAYSLLNEVRAHIQNLEEKTANYNIVRNKCLCFDLNFNNFLEMISELNGQKELEPLQDVFRLALSSYNTAYNIETCHLTQTDIPQKVLKLIKELQELESNLSLLILTREQEIQKNVVSPIAHNKYKRRQPESAGTPQHSRNSSLLFKAPRTGNRCVRKILFDKENTPNKVPVPGIT